MTTAKYTQYTIDIALENAKQMIKTGEVDRKFSFGNEEDGASLYLSVNKESIVDGEEIVVDDKVFYFGFFRK